MAAYLMVTDALVRVSALDVNKQRESLPVKRLRVPNGTRGRFLLCRGNLLRFVQRSSSVRSIRILTIAMNRKIDEVKFLATYRMCVDENRSYDDFSALMGLDKTKAYAAIKRYRAKGHKLPNLLRNGFRERDLRTEYQDAYAVAIVEGWDYETLAHRLDISVRVAMSYRHILIQEGIELPELKATSKLELAG